MGILLALLLVPLLDGEQAAPAAGNVEAGKQYWLITGGEANIAAQASMCWFCHGAQAEGAWGPDLAGRGLSLEQFKRAIRQPWGVMPAYSETQITDKEIADVHAYVSSLPKVTKMGPWRWQDAPADAPLGQRLSFGVGCGQCHEPEQAIPRRWVGGWGENPDYEYFAKQIYNHSEKFPRGKMGNYSRDRVPDMVLREIFKFFLDAGLRVPMVAQLRMGAAQGGNTTYNLMLFNDGMANKGMTAEKITIFVRVPKGTSVVSATGTGYKGVRPLAQLGIAPAESQTPGRFDMSKLPERPKPDMSGDVAVWEVPKIGPAEKQNYTLTLSGAGSTPEVLRGFVGSSVYWEKPGIKMILKYRDLRMPDKGDQVAISPPPVPRPSTQE